MHNIRAPRCRTGALLGEPVKSLKSPILYQNRGIVLTGMLIGTPISLPPAAAGRGPPALPRNDEQLHVGAFPSHPFDLDLWWNREQMWFCSFFTLFAFFLLVTSHYSISVCFLHLLCLRNVLLDSFPTADIEMLDPCCCLPVLPIQPSEMKPAGRK